MQTPVDSLYFMRRALELAQRGAGHVHPNPLVGAVVVKNGKIIGEGAHERFGGPHAEVRALSSCKKDPRGATLYVTLEPCAHTGKTPPCARFIAEKKIKKVVVGARDPNPLVAGKGLRFLKKAGVRIVTGVLEKEATALNRDFNHWMQNKTPYVIFKCAQSLDGNIATRSGESQWITGEEARRFGHRLRAFSDAILVGVNTILKDDPRLNVRLAGKKSQPVKIVLDAFLRTPPSARIFSGSPVFLVTTQRAPLAKRRRLEKKATLLFVKEKSRGLVDWKELLKQLGAMGLVNILIEGGSETAGSAFAQHIVNETYFFLAPKIIGGRSAVHSVGGEGIGKLKQALRLRKAEIRRIGEDILVHGVVP